MDFLSHESQYRGNKKVQDRSKLRISICGVGAVGSRLTNALVAQGYQNIVVIDKDRVEVHNCGIQDYGLPDVGRFKSDMLQSSIFRRLKITIGSKSCELKLTNIKKLLSGSDLVIDAFDNYESRELVRSFCEKNKINCLHVGLSHDGFAEIEWNENYKCHVRQNRSSDVTPPCEYPLATNLVLFSVVLCAEVVNLFTDSDIKQTLHFTLGDLNVDKVSSCNL